MKLSAPKQITWTVAVVLGVLGILGNFGIIAALAAYSMWMLTIGFVLLAIGTLFNGI